ncbi:hypothetical protein HYH03_012502 [Edaphochlamys debaryana]|uniref:Uncharacterized protein n=1 Tax=Edaphochlamys debaryana TaxID=47281 RepID=A0A835XVE8_9CHLO|nr:hypothetical protein HYH03_012502 [Edaphochlamys debaryana]|eukprot:KAG2489066.1 hypothetical protein HYH03_012502 [Edaphochlamys debaryana]
METEPKVSQDAALKACIVFHKQLEELPRIWERQAKLLVEVGLRPPKDDADETNEKPADAALDVHALPDVLAVSSDALDGQRLQALAWKANYPQEGVRKELRAFAKVVRDRLGQAAKAAKVSLATPGQATANPAGPGPKEWGSASRAPYSLTAGFSGGSGAQQPGEAREAAGAAAISEDERQLAAQLAKLATVLVPETGGIAGMPISAVGVFTQLLLQSADWRLRRAMLEAVGRSGPEVLGRLAQNSRVLDALQAWIQEAQVDNQATMLRLIMAALACLPMRRELLRGSKLEAALEALAAPVGAPGPGGAPAGPGLDEMRRRFGGAAAGVLSDWRRGADAPAPRRAAWPPPSNGARLLGLLGQSSGGLGAAGAAGAATALRQAPAGLAQPTAAAAEAAARVTAAAAAAAAAAHAAQVAEAEATATAEQPPPAVAAANGVGGGGGGGAAKRPLPALPAPPRGALVEARGAPRPRVGGGGGGGGGGVQDMTAKLGERGSAADADVVPGFRSRVGDGRVRRSGILARPTKAAGPTPGPGPAGPGPGSGPALAPQHPQHTAQPRMGVAGAAAGEWGQGPSGSDPAGPAGPGPGSLYGAAGSAAAGAGAGASRWGPAAVPAAAAAPAAPVPYTLPYAPDPGDAGLAAGQRPYGRRLLAQAEAEARRQPDVAAAVGEFWERAASLARARAARVEREAAELRPEAVWAGVVAMREGLAWVPPPALAVQRAAEEQPPGLGEESGERAERARAQQSAPRVYYPTREHVPPSPAEPPPGPGGDGQAPVRPIPWCPPLDQEGGTADCIRQNDAMWAKGVRLPEYVVQPALLDRVLTGLMEQRPPPQPQPAPLYPQLPQPHAHTQAPQPLTVYAQPQPPSLHPPQHPLPPSQPLAVSAYGNPPVGPGPPAPLRAGYGDGGGGYGGASYGSVAYGSGTGGGGVAALHQPAYAASAAPYPPHQSQQHAHPPPALSPHQPYQLPPPPQTQHHHSYQPPQAHYPQQPGPGPGPGGVGPGGPQAAPYGRMDSGYGGSASGTGGWGRGYQGAGW